ncbi:Myb-like DNA-binding domain containing protein [Tritrichomonas foetus]|uniref:Myb-like DNA-binding domain containing protein n=1 Tax=Tritrichomonas foetus TaxID=1144522 RepID=A0A1J4J045_9EUKA|nr:Myb-like DNA-binding domain containing protein [Tritrichomonas foetus]|eukprot:OHS92968.1 Myb-like DNA-binding domain containing protein [Tritrichomonas foetus]
MNPIAPTRNRRRNNVSSKNQKWSAEEDALLRKIASESETVNWKAAESQFPGKTSQQIFERWTKVLDPQLLKGSWTRQEDEVIINFVRIYGCKSWTKLANMLPGRIGKQCRERWLNHLNPDLNRGPWTPEEDQQLLILHEQFGNHWSKISALMPSRADNMIKNRWYSTLSKKTKEEVEESIRSIQNGMPSASSLNQMMNHQNMAGIQMPAIEQTPKKVNFNQAPMTNTPSQNTTPTQENLPKPLFEEMPMDTPSLWTPSITNTPFSGTPLGLISPMMPSASPFALLSPYKKMTPMFSPWAADTPKSGFMSPMHQKYSPPSLSENRAELMNLIVHQ